MRGAKEGMKGGETREAVEFLLHGESVHGDDFGTVGVLLLVGLDGGEHHEIAVMGEKLAGAPVEHLCCQRGGAPQVSIVSSGNSRKGNPTLKVVRGGGL